MPEIAAVALHSSWSELKPHMRATKILHLKLPGDQGAAPN